jgi:nitroimidazol reductase NimA-like FMN-containing flavoprotein (pyridoxamine 5'-phosphate oxidase superfamily)
MIDTRGPWAWNRVESYLRDTVVPARVACLSHTGWPIVLSLWYLYRDGVLWCASQSDSRVVQRLREDPRCAFEIAPNEPPYCGVRGQGRATTDAARGVEILRALLARYFGSEDSELARRLLSRGDREVAIRIEPIRISTWDYTKRMTGH